LQSASHRASDFLYHNLISTREHFQTTTFKFITWIKESLLGYIWKCTNACLRCQRWIIRTPQHYKGWSTMQTNTRIITLHRVYGTDHECHYNSHSHLNYNRAQRLFLGYTLHRPKIQRILSHTVVAPRIWDHMWFLWPQFLLHSPENCPSQHIKPPKNECSQLTLRCKTVDLTETNSILRDLSSYHTNW